MVEVEERKKELPSFEAFKEKVERFREKYPPMSAKFTKLLRVGAKLGDFKAKVALDLDEKPVKEIYEFFTKNEKYRRICLEILDTALTQN
ncbi:MAG: hypothetical protein ACTSPL_06280 [Candidatus Odinarchaeia archaeon]